MLRDTSSRKSRMMTTTTRLDKAFTGAPGRDRAKIWAGIALIALPQVIPHGLSQRTRKGEREDGEKQIAAQHGEETHCSASRDRRR